ncbi:MAG: hypothetical protein KBA46_03530 [Candidatus Omnitrophica bacterium]|nr:hypothetical protein [Candidatus Omnitrophota bacterium]
MDKVELIARLRQLLACDTNALELYSDLATMFDDAATQKILVGIVADEKRHMQLSAQLLDLLSDNAL